MKRSVIFFMALILLLSLVACGPKKEKVELTIPADFVDEEGHLEGFGSNIDRTENEDGSVTVRVTEEEQNKALASLKEGLDRDFDSMVESKDTPYIREIDYSQGFKEFVVKVDAGFYDEDLDFTPMILALRSGLYQVYSGEEYRVKVRVLDFETGEELNSAVYPEDLEAFEPLDS